MADVIDLGMIPGVTLADVTGPSFTLPITLCGTCPTLLDRSWFVVDLHDPAARRLACLWCATDARPAGHDVEHLIEGDDFWLPTARTGETR
jgi:hypothetical protein